MPRERVTTTKNGFRVEDITFRDARKQSSIEDEIETVEVGEEDIKAPVSLTPEQVTKFLKNKISASSDSNEKRVYSQMIKWINELAEKKKEVITLTNKLEEIIPKKEDNNNKD